MNYGGEQAVPALVPRDNNPKNRNPGAEGNDYAGW
jgi:hypothetical protein